MLKKEDILFKVDNSGKVQPIEIELVAPINGVVDTIKVYPILKDDFNKLMEERDKIDSKDVQKVIEIHKKINDTIILKYLHEPKITEEDLKLMKPYIQGIFTSTIIKASEINPPNIVNVTKE